MLFWHRQPRLARDTGNSVRVERQHGGTHALHPARSKVRGQVHTDHLPTPNMLNNISSRFRLRNGDGDGLCALQGRGVARTHWFGLGNHRRALAARRVIVLLVARGRKVVVRCVERRQIDFIFPTFKREHIVLNWQDLRHGACGLRSPLSAAATEREIREWRFFLLRAKAGRPVPPEVRERRARVDGTRPVQLRLPPISKERRSRQDRALFFRRRDAVCSRAFPRAIMLWRLGGEARAGVVGSPRTERW